MTKKTKSNPFNEFKEKVLSGGDYAYVYDKEDNSLTDAVFNVVSDFYINDIKDWKTTTTTSDKTITITGEGAGVVTSDYLKDASWVYPYYPTTTGTVTTTSATVTIPYYSEETF